MSDLVPYLLQVISGLLVILSAILAWFGTRLHTKLDEIKACLHTTELETQQKISGLDTRVTTIEARMVLVHPEFKR